MSWLPLTEHLLQGHPERRVALLPELRHDRLQQQALRFAAQLQARRVQRLALYMEDAGELAIALLGAWRAGVAVLLPADNQPHSKARLADRHDLWLEQLEPLADDQPALAPAALEPAACRLTLCTSGSSGEAKLIDKSLAQLVNEIAALEALWGNALGDAPVLASVSAQHIYGLLFRLLWPLCAGRPFVRRALPFPEDLQRESLAVRADAACLWVTSPALLKRIGDNLDWPRLQALRGVFSSGGALPPEAARQLRQQLGQWPTEIYGSSETGGIGWRQGEQPWQPFAGVQLALGDEGALQIRSPYLPAGHCEHSMDAASLHADGRFSLLGRLDRIVKLEEKRVALPQLEQRLSEHPWVAEARCGVVRQGRASIGALVALSPAGLHALRNQGRKALTAALRQQLLGHCEPIALPRRFRLFDALPDNSQGKLPQAHIEQLLEAPRPRLPIRESSERQDDQWLLRLRVPVDLAHFSGHFPQTPVLPGVVQIDWAQQLAGELFDTLDLRFAGMEVLKFQQLVRPGDRLQLTLRLDSGRGKLYFAFHNGESPCSSGRILLGATADA